MPKLVPITPKKLAGVLNRLGFEERDAEGSHVLFRHPDGRTTIIAMKTKEISRGHKEAVVIIARKLVRTMYCLLRDGVSYDSAKVSFPNRII